MTKTIHILQNGKTLCEFMPRTATKNFPKGHDWVGIKEVAHATCSTCLKRMEAQDEKESAFYKAIVPQILLAIFIFLAVLVLFKFLAVNESPETQAPGSVKFWLAAVLSIWFGLRHERRGKDKEWVIQFAWLPRYIGKKEGNGWPRFVWFSLYERLVISNKGNYHIERQPFSNGKHQADDYYLPATYEKTHIL